MVSSSALKWVKFVGVLVSGIRFKSGGNGFTDAPGSVTIVGLDEVNW